MSFNPYSLFTIVLLVNVFMILFIITTNISNTALKIPIGVIYASLTIVGLRLFIPIEIWDLSFEINSQVIMSKLNNIWLYTLFEFSFGNVTVSKLFYTVWIIGAIMLLIKRCRKQIRFLHIMNQIPEMYDEQVSRQLDLIYSKYKFKSKPKIIINRHNGSPAEFGYFRQTIVINYGIYSDEEMYCILLHELAHYHLKNNIADFFIAVLKIVFWWNPIIHWFGKHFEDLMETYADRVVANDLNPIEKANYLECLLRVYNTSDELSGEFSSFISPMVGFNGNFIKRRFEIITKEAKINIPMSISIISMSLMWCMLTFCIVFQPFYDTTENDMPLMIIDENNSYIVKEGDLYVLYCNDVPLIANPDKEALEKHIK